MILAGTGPIRTSGSGSIGKPSPESVSQFRETQLWS